MSTTPDKLRAGKVNDWIPIPGADGEMVALAMEIADNFALGVFRRHSIGQDDGWCNFSAMPESHLQYLLLRGLIEKHPAIQHRARVKVAA
jgi:hypothetical protein